MDIAPFGWLALIGEGLRAVFEAATQEVSGSDGKPKWVDFASGVQSIVVAAAILLGGALAAIRYRLFRETAIKADFQVRESTVIRTENRQVMYINVMLANRARTRLFLKRVNYKWHAVSAQVTHPPKESYQGPKDLISDAQDLEPGKEAWGVALIGLPNDAQGAILWVELHRERKGLDWLLTWSMAALRREEYQEPEVREWTFFVPIKEAHMEELQKIVWTRISGDDLNTIFTQGTIGPPTSEAAGLVIRVAERAVDVGWFGKRRAVAASLSVGEPASRTEIIAIDADDLEEIADGEYRVNGFRATGLEEGWLTTKLTFEDGLIISNTVELR